MRRFYQFLLLILVPALWITSSFAVKAVPEVQAPSVILMESTSGQIIYEKNSAERRAPASITKIMTLLLTFEAIENGQVKLEDDVLTSEYASSMGGSQVFLAEGEVQSLETMIKCITVASGNDACVAVAEHISGSESAFVEKMNERAMELGMVDTHFEDCCGLTDSANHYSCARDVAIMSRELILNHPKIFEYSKIWMEDITHVTRQGTSIFTLTSTNKLLKQYQYTTGLKTGFTSKAKYCVSATANKDGVELIAVVMGADTSKLRSSDAKALLTYGFAVCNLYTDIQEEALPPCAVKGGVSEEVPVIYEEPFRYLDIKGADLSSINKEIRLPDTVQAPVKHGDKAGEAVYYLDGQEIGSVAILYADTVERANLMDYLKKVIGNYLL